MRPHIFWIVLSFIGLSWAVNSMYAYSKKLDEPIFLEHYVETSIQDITPLTFYYLANKNDTSMISHIDMNGVQGFIQQDSFFFDEPAFNYNTPQTFAHYVLRSIHVELSQFDIEDTLQDGDFSFNEMEVFFNDGRVMTVAIGEVIVRLNHPAQVGLSAIEVGSSHELNSFTYEVEQDLIIDNITTSFQEQLRDNIDLKVQFSRNTSQSLNEDWEALQGTDIADVKFPIELKKDEVITVYSRVSSLNRFLEPSIIISGTTKDGTTFESSNIFYQHPYLEQQDVNTIIKKKNEVNADE